MPGSQNRKASKSITLIILTFGVALFAGLAQADPFSSSGSSVANEMAGSFATLTLEQAVADALANNPSIRLARLAVEKARVGLDEAEDRASDIDADKIFNLDLAKAKYVAPRQAQADLVAAEKSLAAAENGLRFQVEKAYYALLKAREMVRVTEASLKRAEAQLAVAKAGYKAGTVPYSDVLGAEAQVSSVGADLGTARNNELKARMQLNRILNRDLDDQLELVPEVAKVALEDIDLTEDIKGALRNRSEIVQARERLAVAELSLEVTGRYFTPNTYIYQTTSLATEQARVAVNDAEQDVRLDVRMAYLDMLEAENRISALEKAVAQARESSRLAELRYKAGVATQLEALSAEVALQQAEIKAVEAVHAFNLARARYRKAIGA